MTSVFDRLWARVHVLGPNDCWEWQGYVDRKTGYGQIGRGLRREGLALTHRVAWESENGPVPEGLIIRHKCDNRPCCNPAHLEPGTHADNARDKVERGRDRSPFGEAHPHARLTSEQVTAIRQRFEPGGHPARREGSTAAELAAEFGISRQYVRDIANGRWRTRD